MSKKIFSAQEWENVHSEALPNKLNDVEKQTSSIVYSNVEEDLNRVVCEIESLHIDIAPSYNDWVNLGFAIADGLVKAVEHIFIGSANFITTINMRKLTSNIHIVCKANGKASP